MKRVNAFFLAIVLSLLPFSCSSKKKPVIEDLATFDAEGSSVLETISKYKVFFGHKSVGNDIIKGLKLIDAYDKKNSIEIVDLKDSLLTDSLPQTYFAHALVGRNGDCQSKATAFSSFMNDDRAKNVDVALFKFCFIDFNNETNVDSIVSIYKETMKVLESRYPNVKFLYTTVPLLRKSGLSSKLKGVIKDIIGMENDNVVRNKYNKKIRESFPEKQIYDIARIQSMDIKGNMNFEIINGDTVYHMYDEYTSDGRHLNQVGQRLAAQGLIKAIAVVMAQ